jgi:hypothetical protein
MIYCCNLLDFLCDVFLSFYMRITTGFLAVRQKPQFFGGWGGGGLVTSKGVPGCASVPCIRRGFHTFYYFALLNNNKGCFWNFPIIVRTVVLWKCSNYLFCHHCVCYNLMRAADQIAEISRV